MSLKSLALVLLLTTPAHAQNYGAPRGDYARAIADRYAFWGSGSCCQGVEVYCNAQNQCFYGERAKREREADQARKAAEPQK